MDTLKKLLVTGFDPFGGEKINPSWEAVKLLPEKIGSFSLKKCMIPTAFHKGAQTVLNAADQWQPDVILCIGQAGGRSAVTPERIGVNLRDARIQDNAGSQPQEERIISDGQDGYFATVPVKAMAEAIRTAGYPAAVSNTAGTFVCNEVLYTLLHHFRDTPVQVGFIHVPFLPEQGNPNMPLEDIAAALQAAIQSLDKPVVQQG